ncbi:MAG: S8 family serine peptidase [Bryobacterales bacterium]|nr:S8 family serine peptidase [Bryobacterales bacterium]
MRISRTRLIMIALLLVALAGSAWAERVIIKYQKPYAPLVQLVNNLGGRVTHQFRYVNAVAADVPSGALPALQARLAPDAVRKDLPVALPQPPKDRKGTPLLAGGQASASARLDASGIRKTAASNPNAYLVNNVYMNLGPLHGAGTMGQGMKVAVIDSGIRPGFPHIDLDGSVIGGEDLVGDGMGWSNFDNEGHGTFVAGMISANVVFSFSPASALLQSVQMHCPSCVLNGNQIPMIGSAPLSSIYALRVFPPGAGAPESRIIAAMERVLLLKENFDNGVPEEQNPDGSYNSLNVQVCNMSLGGGTMLAGRDVEDELTQAFLARNVVLVTSSGNAGPSGTTVGSPGTGYGVLTVGAASSPVHERVLRDVQYGLGAGSLYRPFEGLQTAYFSSRGPNADGKSDPEVVANGFASYGQGFSAATNGISLASGTSFASPSVAGVAALLRQAVPTASAAQIGNAIVMSANPGLITDGSGPFDQGAGFVDGAAALALLQGGTVPDTPPEPGLTNALVSANLAQGAGIQSHAGNFFRRVNNLQPGQRYEVYYSVPANTEAVYVTLSNVTPGPVQNVLFGDDVLLAVHSAKTSAIGEGDYRVFGFTKGGNWAIVRPDHGLMRITVSGDWTNASPISANLTIGTSLEIERGATAAGVMVQGGLAAIPFNVPEGAGKLEARLQWAHAWGAYPANDLDLILVRPDSAMILTGASWNSPEYADIDNPMPGTWYALVDGFTVYTAGDPFKLRVKIDGAVIR